MMLMCSIMFPRRLDNFRAHVGYDHQWNGNDGLRVTCDTHNVILLPAVEDCLADEREHAMAHAAEAELALLMPQLLEGM